MNPLWGPWARFIERFSGWELWATLTYRRPVTLHGARRHPERFGGALATRAGGHVVIACAGDPQSEGRAHFHVLVGAVGPPMAVLRADLVARAWREAVGALAGHVQAEALPGAGCAPYLAKHSDPEIFVGCPRPRSNACRRARGCAARRQLPALFE